jgi:pimeloyl-ACP methyl ester carboxylesterase
MTMNRRAFSSAVVVGTVAALVSARATAAAPAKARNIVFVHGLFADGSCWSDVIARLQPAGFNCTSVQNPLTTLPEAVASAQRVLERQNGPTVLVGHSFSGMIVTEAGVHPNVSALVYVAARAPDAGEDYTEDRTINPDLERFMAKRMGARTIEVKASHLSLISHPEEIARLILEAAGQQT